jgi:hypothetical protein
MNKPSLRQAAVAVAIFLALSSSRVQADWKMLPAQDGRTPLPDAAGADAQPVQVGDELPEEQKFRWLIGDLEIPAEIEGQPTAGMPVAMRINCADGGEVFVDGQFYSRFDNDRPALVLISKHAEPGKPVRLAVQVYGKVQGGATFGEANWVIVDPPRARETLPLTVDVAHTLGDVPDGIAGLSQGGGLSDYDDATAAKLREGGFKWFRMDNVLTNALKKDDAGEIVYDWADLDRRVDFMYKMGAEPILAASYMPQVLDAVENHDRQSAPNDYGRWEELCYEAAQRCIDRGVRVPFWEVWNEVNTGWLKPGPDDHGDERFQKLYNEALGRLQPETEVIRRFEAYCKLYKATVDGVRRADPKAQFGGPALASGPFENDECGHCFHGRGFTRGLMAYCTEEKLPLNFLSWHEYFQPWQTVDREAKALHEYLEDYPQIKPQVKSLMITEWNEAWWTDRPHDHEVGAAWCADSLVRGCLPNGVNRPCFFYVKQGDDGFRGDFSLLMKDNVPKASYNVLKMFNGLSGQWIELKGADDDVCGVAAWDEEKQRLAVILVNYRDRYAMTRRVALNVSSLPDVLRGGTWREWQVDGVHSNVWNNREHAELEQVDAGRIEDGQLTFERTLSPNSVTMIEITPENANEGS